MKNKTFQKAIQSDPNNEARLLELITENPSVSRAELAKRLDLSERQIRKIIDQLRNVGKLKREGGKFGNGLLLKNNKTYITFP
ncbi:MAG: helix-turn-helix domain-containing protein [Bacteroides intestinalis]